MVQSPPILYETIYHPPRNHNHKIISALGVKRHSDDKLSVKESSLNIKSMHKRAKNTLTQYFRLGLDSHEDMTCVGHDAYIIENVHGHTCTVHPFHDSYNPIKDVKVCNAAFAFDQSDGMVEH